MPDSHAGMHAIGWLPSYRFDQLDKLIEIAAARGLGLYSLVPYFSGKPPMPGLLLGYAGVSVAQIDVATRLLAACMDEAEAAHRFASRSRSRSKSKRDRPRKKP